MSLTFHLFLARRRSRLDASRISLFADSRFFACSVSLPLPFGFQIDTECCEYRSIPIRELISLSRKGEEMKRRLTSLAFVRYFSQILFVAS